MRLRLRNSALLAVLLAALCIGGSIAQAKQADDEWFGETLEPQGSPQKKYAPFPEPDAGYVTDIADLLTRDEEERIEQWLWQVESRTNVEIIVVCIDSIRDYPGTPVRSIEAFARKLFDTYGIGNMPENNGVLLLVAVRDRKARIELGAGYGRRRDGDARRIMDGEIVPSFRDEDYAGGIEKGVKALMLEFAGVRVGLNWPLIGIVIAIPVVGLIAVSLFRSGKRGWGWVCIGLLIVLILFLLYIMRETIRRLPEGGSRGWRSGGLGGFGGGFSGGGGATGTW